MFRMKCVDVIFPTPSSESWNITVKDPHTSILVLEKLASEKDAVARHLPPSGHEPLYCPYKHVVTALHSNRPREDVSWEQTPGLRSCCCKSRPKTLRTSIR